MLYLWFRKWGAYETVQAGPKSLMFVSKRTLNDFYILKSVNYCLGGVEVWIFAAIVGPEHSKLWERLQHTKINIGLYLTTT